jgi:hypothetical protein
MICSNHPAVTINFKTNVRTVIRYKGQEYSSVDQLPAEAQAAYKTALGKGVATASAPNVKQAITLNGQHFASLDEIPAAERKLVDDAMAIASKPSSSWLTPTQLGLALFFAAIVAVIVARLLH